MLRTYKEYRDFWAQKTITQIEKEIKSMRSYMNKHSASYAWHGKNVPSGSIGDGDKLLALMEAKKIAERSLEDRAYCGLLSEIDSDGG